MTRLVRFGVSLDRTLMAEFDRLIDRKGYPTRSEALRDLIRANLVEEEWNDGRETVATVLTVTV